VDLPDGEISYSPAMEKAAATFGTAAVAGETL
jgi:hypothetical protein